MSTMQWDTLPFEVNYEPPVAPQPVPDAATVVARVRRFHAAWGAIDVDEVNPQRLWEQLEQILGGAL